MSTFTPDRLAVSTNSYHTYSLEEALDGIARAGFRSVELSSVPGWTEHVRRDADDAELQRVRDLLERNQLTPVSMSGHTDLASEQGADDFRNVFRLCKALGITMVTTSTGGHDDSSQGTPEEQKAAFLRLFRPLADEAAAMGIAICLETHGGISATGAMAADLVREIDRPNVGVNYDTGNVIFYGATRPETDITAAADVVTHLHIKDKVGGPGVWNFPAIGTGEVDFRPIFDALNEVDFKGPCSVELEFQGEPWPSLDAVNHAMSQSYAYLRQFIPAYETA
ncbi:MAG TPA: sugar phosphate isomerase/epimerase [Thermomicrobiales bacterium]|nr:sugar phosphate isomerase/epimerase [Thermomicrobiales bacterium]